MRVFTNDEIANSVVFLLKAPEYSTFEDYRFFLEKNLPYNSQETRRRRANYILERFYSTGSLDTPLSHFIKHFPTEEALKPVIFYHVLKAEPIAAKVAEELIYPALPIGKVEREQMREFTLRYLPDSSDSSQKNMLRALFYTYGLLGAGSIIGDVLHFQLRQGNRDSFVYVFTSEYYEPGIYSFDSLYDGPVHRWLLWDREWIRRQLYALRDFGILSRLSEIDTVKQFTVDLDQAAALRAYFDAHDFSSKIIREMPEE